MRTLVWFRADLRTHDHAALHHAAAASDDGIIGLFILSPKQWLLHDWAAVKVDFILRTLGHLRADLAKLNIPLIIATTPGFDSQPDLVLRTAKKHACGSVYFNDEYEINEARRDEVVRELGAREGIIIRSFTDQCMVKPGEVRTGEGKFFTVFTPFKKAMYKHLAARGVGAGEGGFTLLPAPKKQPTPPPISAAELGPIPDYLPGFTSSIDPALWPAGEQAALARLDRFCQERITRYKATRDTPASPVPGGEGVSAQRERRGLRGSEKPNKGSNQNPILSSPLPSAATASSELTAFAPPATTSVLSPYLAMGAINHRQMVNAALAVNANRFEGGPGGEGVSHWISEVVWREFYRHILVGFPRVCMHRAFKPATERIRWSDNAEHFAAWSEGRTGIPIVDAGMRQLLTTGWMHNRIRMICAMYLTKDLFIDWRKGERHFMHHLIDGDLASNNGGWQWSASTGTDSAPYFRIFNPITQSRKFDPAGAYIRAYVPELAGLDGGAEGDGPIHDPSALPALLRPRLDYPAPLVDRAKVKDRVLAAFQAL